MMTGSGNLVEKRVKEPLENTATDIRQTNMVAQEVDRSAVCVLQSWKDQSNHIDRSVRRS